MSATAAVTMRILMLSPYPHIRGPLPKHTPLLVEGLRDTGCEVVSEPWGRRGENEPALRKLTNLIQDIGRIRNVLSGRPFDVAVVKTSHEWKSLLRVIPLLVAVRRSVPTLIVQFHGGRSDALVGPGLHLFKLASRLLLRASDGLLLLSAEEADLFSTFCPKGQYRTVANPYASDTPPPDPSRADGCPTIIFAGRLVVEKGIFDVLAALSLMGSHPGCRLLVCGSGPAEAEARETGRRLGANVDVVFAGHLTEAQLARAYRSAHIFVLPTYWCEGFPTAITEAMDAGLPIVTTRIRGMADHLVENVNAVFVPQRDPEALAAALERILSDRVLREDMGRANREKVLDFAPQRVARDYLEAIQDIAAVAARS